MLNHDADAADAEDVEKKCVGVRESVCRLCPLMHYASRISSPYPRPDQNTHIMQTLQIQKTASHAISTRNQTYRKLEADDIMQNCLRSRYLNPFCIFIINIIFRPDQTHIYNRACVIYYQAPPAENKYFQIFCQ